VKRALNIDERMTEHVKKSDLKEKKKETYESVPEIIEYQCIYTGKRGRILITKDGEIISKDRSFKGKKVDYVGEISVSFEKGSIISLIKYFYPAESDRQAEKPADGLPGMDHLV
jgi:sensor histidine kinase regulating citrate/malate metabolism